MAIIDSELLMLASKVITNTTANGGKMDNNAPVTAGAVNNVWESAFKAERDDGSTAFRKTFLKVNNDDDGTLFNPQFWLDIVTPADDWVCFFPATQTDTQNDITGSEDCYGCSILQADVSAAGGSIVVTVEDVSMITGGADEIFRDGDTIRITDKVLPSSVSGNEELHVINGTPTNSGNDVTITLTGTLTNDYTTAGNTRVMSMHTPSDIATSVTDLVDTTAGDGTFDDVAEPIVLDNIGTIDQTITVTFTGANTFTVASDDPSVSLAGGDKSVGTEYAPSNPDVSKPYFTITFAGFLDTWANGDTLVFKTNPASYAIWQKRVIPPLADSLAGNKISVVFAGESV